MVLRESYCIDPQLPSAGPLDPVEEAIFNTASGLQDVTAREVFLSRACGSDTASRGRIEAVLLSYEGATRLCPDDAPESPAPPKASEREMFGETAPVGVMIGRYKLRERIGEGGCGVVYVADQEEPVQTRRPQNYQAWDGHKVRGGAL